ncbi:chromate efflux transporter [Brevibacterium aurantiacum]|uniref:chromate efflux transporter n=1 Tax=Brevibacterium aurantiacum TaxID=273384 RepID=UPI000F64C4AC|nr:chromate efflux transporter [Brevibacterium aurantiacum]AZL10469.1 chromate transporter [Brevibacterium aurantiacum]
MTDTTPTHLKGQGSAWEVFRIFLRLGLTSFGGPIAHLGYFRTEAVERRKWLDEQEYADLVTLCQFLPGPASSQVGFAIGMHRAGALGALAAFLAFTVPSAVIMVVFAYGAALFTGPVGEGLLNGLKIVAVAIVAQAVLGMARNLTPDKQRASIAAVAAAAALLIPGAFGQITAIALGAIAGYLLCRKSSGATGGVLHFPVKRRVGITSLVIFMTLLLGLPLVVAATGSSSLAVFDAFYRAGALVFGGGHVVLPLLQAGVVDTGWVSDQQFLAGYGVAQAVPGPLFTFAAYLGAISDVGPGGVLGAGVALAAVFLPGFLLLVGVLPFWNVLRQRAWSQAVMSGANAAVVGILAAALYQPVFSTAVTGQGPFALGLVCFVLLIAWKLPPWMVVVVGAAGGVVLALLT